MKYFVLVLCLLATPAFARSTIARAEFCQEYSVYSPHTEWSREIETIGFYGEGRHEFSVQTSWDEFDRKVTTNVRYWKFMGWHEDDFTTRNVNDFWADGVAGLRHIYLKFQTDPYPTTARARVCTFH